MSDLKDALVRVVICIIIVATLFSVTIGIGWFCSGMEARRINARYGTDYTTSDIFWFGDKIVISDYIKIIEEGENHGD